MTQRTDALRRAYDHYRTTHVANRWSPRHVEEAFEIFRPFLPGDNDGLIVELGCGAGELLRLLQQSGYQRLLGVDLSPEQVATAQERGIPATRGDAREFLRDLDSEASLILADSFLEHLETDELLEVLEAARMRLKEGGTFVARLPNPQSPFGGALVFGDITHRSALAPLAVQQALRVSGFEDIEIAAAAPSVFGIRSRARRLLWGMQQRLFRLAFAIEAGAGIDGVFSLNYVVSARRPGRRRPGE